MLLFKDYFIRGLIPPFSSPLQKSAALDSNASPSSHNTEQAARYRTNNGQSGAALVELAIALPVLLLLLFFVMFLSHLISARAALSTAVNSVRSASTRANLPISPRIINDIENFDLDRLKPLLASEGLEDDAFSNDGSNSYKKLYESQYPGISKKLADLEREDLISMVYAINIVRQSLGEHVKTPCREPGCLLCLPVPAPWTYAPPGGIIPITTPPPRARFAGIRCEYRPDGFLFSVLNSLVRFINPNSRDLSLIVLRRERSLVFNGWEG